MQNVILIIFALAVPQSSQSKLKQQPIQTDEDHYNIQLNDQSANDLSNSQLIQIDSSLDQLSSNKQRNKQHQHQHSGFTDELDESRQESEDDIVKATADSIKDDSIIYGDGALPQPNIQRMTQASQSLSHYVDIVDETVNGPQDKTNKVLTGTSFQQESPKQEQEVEAQRPQQAVEAPKPQPAVDKLTPKASEAQKSFNQQMEENEEKQDKNLKGDDEEMPHISRDEESENVNKLEEQENQMKFSGSGSAAQETPEIKETSSAQDLFTNLKRETKQMEKEVNQQQLAKNETSGENQPGPTFAPKTNGSVSNSSNAANSTNVTNSTQNGTSSNANVTGSCGALDLNLTGEEAAEEQEVEKKRIEEDEAKIAAFRKQLEDQRKTNRDKRAAERIELKKKHQKESCELETKQKIIEKQHEIDVQKATESIKNERENITQQKLEADTESRKQELLKKEEKIKSAKKVIDLIVEDLKLSPNTTSADEFLKREAELKEKRKKAEEEYKRHLESQNLNNETAAFKKIIEDEVRREQSLNGTVQGKSIPAGQVSAPPATPVQSPLPLNQPNTPAQPAQPLQPTTPAPAAPASPPQVPQPAVNSAPAGQTAGQPNAGPYADGSGNPPVQGQPGGQPANPPQQQGNQPSNQPGQTPPQQQNPTPSQAPAPAKTAEPTPAKQEQSAPAKQEQPAPAKQGETAPAKQEQPAPAKQEQSAPAKQEQPAPAKQGETAPAKQGEQSPATQGNPAAKQEQPQPAKQEQPAPAKQEQPAPTKQEQPAPAKQGETGQPAAATPGQPQPQNQQNPSQPGQSPPQGQQPNQQQGPQPSPAAQPGNQPNSQQPQPQNQPSPSGQAGAAPTGPALTPDQQRTLNNQKERDARKAKNAQKLKEQLGDSPSKPQTVFGSIANLFRNAWGTLEWIVS